MKNMNWKELGVEAILITNPKNIRHFTGLETSFGFVILQPEETTLLVDGRYYENAKKTFKTGKIILYKGLKTLEEIIKNFKKLGFESDFVTVDFMERFKKMNKNIVGINGQELRMIKNSNDIKDLREAVRITKEVMEWASKKLVDGITEKEISRLVIFKLNEMGSETLDYDPIISAGPNSSLPHAHPSDRKMKEGETVMFDFAAVINGYTADLTRNYSVGELKNPEIIKIQKIVEKSQMAGIQAVKPGVTGAEIDAICRKVIEDAGYGDKFFHSTGHGLGRDVHELPNVAASSKTPFVPGHVITVEPGIYLEGIGGIRIEDDILITETGFEIL